MPLSPSVRAPVEVAEVFDPEQEPFRSFQIEVARFIRGHFGLDYERSRFESGVGFDARGWSTLRDGGWLSLGLPESIGGLGDLREVVLFQLELGRSVVNTPFVPVVVQSALALAESHNAELSNSLSEMQSGGLLVTSSIGADPASVAYRGARSNVTATVDGSRIVLSGESLFLQAAQAARWVLVHAKADSGEAFVGCWPTDGLQIDATPTVDRTDFWRARFQNAATEADYILARGAAADALAASVALRGVLATAAESVGGAEGCFNLTAEYVKNRVQFGRPVGSFQAIKHRLADLYLNMTLAKNLVLGAVDEARQGQAGALSHMAKCYSSDLYLSMVKAGAQLHAGVGYTWDHNFQFYLRRAQTLAVLFGDARYHRRKIADLLRTQAAVL